MYTNFFFRILMEITLASMCLLKRIQIMQQFMNDMIQISQKLLNRKNPLGGEGFSVILRITFAKNFSYFLLIVGLTFSAFLLVG